MASDTRYLCPICKREHRVPAGCCSAASYAQLEAENAELRKLLITLWCSLNAVTDADDWRDELRQIQWALGMTPEQIVRAALDAAKEQG